MTSHRDAQLRPSVVPITKGSVIKITHRCVKARTIQAATQGLQEFALIWNNEVLAFCFVKLEWFLRSCLPLR